jgi:putative colanic acid biosynthesis acetyltransferase WcaF
MRHRLLRLAFELGWLVLARWTPVPMHGWRRLLLRCFGATIHSTAKVYPSVRVWYPPNLAMAEHSCLGPQVNCYCMDRIEIGPYALVSQGAYLCGGTHDVDDPHFQLITKPILIGRDAWVAAEAFVGPGVAVGDRAVLGARAVTVKNLDEDWIYVGNPAKSLRRRKLNGAGD